MRQAAPCKPATAPVFVCGSLVEVEGTLHADGTTWLVAVEAMEVVYEIDPAGYAQGLAEVTPAVSPAGRDARDVGCVPGGATGGSPAQPAKRRGAPGRRRP
jgi:hypothetical protein